MQILIQISNTYFKGTKRSENNEDIDSYGENNNTSPMGITRAGGGVGGGVGVKKAI
jgi:hypothetical protein